MILILRRRKKFQNQTTPSQRSHQLYGIPLLNLFELA